MEQELPVKVGTRRLYFQYVWENHVTDDSEATFFQNERFKPTYSDREIWGLHHFLLGFYIRKQLQKNGSANQLLSTSIKFNYTSEESQMDDLNTWILKEIALDCRRKNGGIKWKQLDSLTMYEY